MSIVSLHRRKPAPAARSSLVKLGLTTWQFTLTLSDVAYLRKRRIGTGIYLYIMESYRKGDGKVTTRTLEYLGAEHAVTPARLKRALTYWRVGARKARR